MIHRSATELCDGLLDFIEVPARRKPTEVVQIALLTLELFSGPNILDEGPMILSDLDS